MYCLVLDTYVHTLTGEVSKDFTVPFYSSYKICLNFSCILDKIHYTYVATYLEAQSPEPDTLYSG